jgi:hypothetical protein
MIASGVGSGRAATGPCDRPVAAARDALPGAAGAARVAESRRRVIIG